MLFFPRCSKPPMTIMYMCFRWNARSSFAYNAHSTAVCGLTFADSYFLFLYREESSDIWSTAAIDILHTSKQAPSDVKITILRLISAGQPVLFSNSFIFPSLVLLPYWIWPAAQKMMLFCHKFWTGWSCETQDEFQR